MEMTLQGGCSIEAIRVGTFWVAIDLCGVKDHIIGETLEEFIVNVMAWTLEHAEAIKTAGRQRQFDGRTRKNDTTM